MAVMNDFLTQAIAMKALKNGGSGGATGGNAEQIAKNRADIALLKEGMSNLLGARPVVLAKGDPVKRLELWLFGGEVDEQSVLHIGISDYGGEENMMEMNIPINYCPRCGKKL